MKLLYVQLALGLFQLDHAVKQEIEQLPEQEEEHLLPGGLAGIKRLHNYGTAGGHARGHMDKIIRWNCCYVCVGADKAGSEDGEDRIYVPAGRSIVQPV